MAKPNITLPTYGGKQKKKPVVRKGSRQPSFSNEVKNRISGIGDDLVNAAKVAKTAALGYAAIKSATAKPKGGELTTFNKANSVQIGNIPKGSPNSSPPIPKEYGRKSPVMAVNTTSSNVKNTTSSSRKVESPINQSWDSRPSVTASSPKVGFTKVKEGAIPSSKSPEVGFTKVKEGVITKSPEVGFTKVREGFIPSKPSSKPKSGKGMFSNPANVSAAKAALPGRQPKSMDSPKVGGQMGKSNYRDMSPVTNTPPSSKSTDGFLSSLKNTFTKKPTARGPSEYEQIMSDLQPSRKKRK